MATPDLNLPTIKTSQVIEGLIDDLLQKFHSDGTDPALDTQIEKVYADRHHGAPFHRRKTVTSSLLLGFPGHGKTTAFRAAATRAADLLGMHLVIDPGSDYVPGPDDIVMATEHLSGLAHVGPIMGIPNAVEESVRTENGETRQHRHMVMLSPKRFAVLRRARAAIVVFDDLLNAALPVQNVALSLIEENRYNDLDLGARTLVGGTGNLGTLDGTHTAGRSSAALRTRCKVFLVEDDLNDWCRRTCKEYPSEDADGGIVQFLRNHSDYFHKPDPRGVGSYPTPRTWTKLVSEVAESAGEISHIARSGATSAQGMGEIMERIGAVADATVGREAGHQVRAFLQSRVTGAAPLAKDAMDTGKTDSERFSKLHGNGESSDEQEFDFQYVMTLAEIASARASSRVEEGSSRKSVGAYRHFARSLLTAMEDGLSEQKVATALHHMMFRLAATGSGIAEFVAERPTFKGKQHLEVFGSAFVDVLKENPRWISGDFYQRVFMPEVCGSFSTAHSDYLHKIGADRLSLENLDGEPDEDATLAPR